MMLLKNFEIDRLYFDLETRDQYLQDAVHKISGWYKFINNTFSALFVFENKLYFQLDNEKYSIEDNHSIILENNEYSNTKTVKVYGDDTIVLQFVYDVLKENFNVSPFEYIDSEDFDWGEFIANRVNNKERKFRFIDIMMSDNKKS
jgi:hypothetical protein